MIDQASVKSDEPKKLVDWKNPPELRDLKQNLEDATPGHSAQIKKIEEWLDNLNGTGKAKVQSPKGSSSIVPKLIRKQAEWRYPALSEPFLSTDDIFNVSPITWEDREGAKQNQLVLNYQFNTQIDKVSFIDEFVRAAVDEGTAILRTGWEFEEDEVEEEEPVVQLVPDPETMELHQQLMQMGQENPTKFITEVPPELQQAHAATLETGIPMRGDVIGTQMVKKLKTIVNRPTVEVCDFRNVILDPTCDGNIEKAQFVIFKFETCMSDLKKDKRYQNLEHLDLSTLSILGQPDDSISSGRTNDVNFRDNPRKKFTVYEYWGFWDYDESGIVKPMVASWAGNTLIRMEENPYPDKKLPFVVAQYLPVRKKSYGEPDGALLEDNQKIVGAVTRGMIDVMGRSANGQTGMRKDMLDLTNKRRYEKGLDYEFNGNIDPRQGVYMHTFPEIPRSAEFMLSMNNMEAESMTGVKAFSEGISGNSFGAVATSARGAMDAASKREMAILRRCSAALVSVGRKFISMNTEFLSEEEVIRVTNDEFQVVRRDDLLGNFDLRLTISTAEADNEKSDQLAFMLQTMGTNMDPELSKMILSDIASLRKMPDLAKRIEAYQPEPDPLAQRRAELEIALLEAQIQTEQAKAMQLQSQAQFNGSKAGTEQVKQGNIQSDTDMKNLNFVEQESGTTQMRDLEKHGEQARSQAQLKVLEHEFQREQGTRDEFMKFMELRQKAKEAKK